MSWSFRSKICSDLKDMVTLGIAVSEKSLCVGPVILIVGARIKEDGHGFFAEVGGFFRS